MSQNHGFAESTRLQQGSRFDSETVSTPQHSFGDAQNYYHNNGYQQWIDQSRSIHVFTPRTFIFFRRFRNEFLLSGKRAKLNCQSAHVDSSPFLTHVAKSHFYTFIFALLMPFRIQNGTISSRPRTLPLFCKSLHCFLYGRRRHVFRRFARE